MVSKNQIKLITSLQHKKYRKEENLFIAEGKKVIGELINAGFELVWLFQTDAVFSEKNFPVVSISPNDLKKFSALSTANNCLAVFKIPAFAKFSHLGLILALDDIRDPGNFGTIIRLCDWFGIKNIYCSEQTVDLYNPKVVQSTMGSLARVNVSYGNLPEFLQKTKLPVFGTFMDGDNIYQANLPQEGIIVLGNEANGISVEVTKTVTQKIAIPRFGDIQATESLNVATAAAIVLSEFCRRF
ncbi:RNA methyltransferase [Flavobacterium sp. NST-5]|uniref:RNA methyltransferase n=1 Tax=Flavobacterium ichthyis TaxID=2698827 RepID=A0ABW9Z4W2_9FLAO|nr:RNA methyltransferase [Flavobacterium ichthyis]NBL63878.1 RNA methyltransferase [Flavobacterium ichthyis]